MFKWFTLDLNLKKNTHNVHLNGKNIIILKINEKFFAIEDNCPHQNMPINKGKILDNNIVCPFHDASFCIQTGLVNNTLSIDNLNIFKIKTQNQKIKIKIEFI